MTPIKAEILENQLGAASYQHEEIDFLVRGFKEGFSLGYQGPWNRRDTSNNLPLRVGSSTILWEHIIKEVKEKRFAGPFNEIPFKNFVQSPIGLVPKEEDKTRLIFHLFYDFKQSGFKSVNYYTPEYLCSVTYHDLDYAVNTCITLGQVPVKFSKVAWYL